MYILNKMNVLDYEQTLDLMQTNNYKSMNDIVNYILPIINITEMDTSRLIQLWKYCTRNVSVNIVKYGRDNICEDIIIELKKNPWFVIYILYENILDQNEKKHLNIETWELYIENSLKYIYNKKISEISDSMKLFETVRLSSNELIEEKITQNVAISKFIYQKLWMTIYNIYSNIEYDDSIVLNRLNVPVNSVEIQKYEKIWSHLQKLQNVDEIPKEFWNWLTTDKLQSHLSRYYFDNPLKISKTELIDLLFNTQHIEIKTTNIVSNYNENIRKLNTNLKPTFNTYLKNKCGILEDYEQFYKIFTRDEAIELIVHFNTRKYEFADYTDSEIYYLLYLCVYYKNISTFITEKKNKIQKRLLEEFLIQLCTSSLNFSLDNNTQNILSDNDKFTSVKDVVLSQDITNKWFINTFRSFKEFVENEIQLYWKCRCSNYHTNNFEKYTNNQISFPEHWKQYTKRMSVINKIGINHFVYENVNYCIIKIGNKYRSSYMYPSTYSELLQKMLNTGEVYVDKKDKYKRNERALYILNLILYHNVSNGCILYKFTNDLVNDDELIEFT